MNIPIQKNIYIAIIAASYVEEDDVFEGGQIEEASTNLSPIT